MLCEICQRLFRPAKDLIPAYKDELEQKYLFTTSLLTIEAGLADGCQLCTQFDAHISSTQDMYGEEFDVLYVVGEAGVNIEILFIETSSRDHVLAEFDMALVLEKKNERLNSWVRRPKLQAYIPSSADTGSEECGQLAEDWIANCIRNHPGCPSRKATDSCKWYPTRLIEIDGSDKEMVLRITKDAVMRGGYATLSHRWGTDSFFMLSSSNLEEFKAGLVMPSDLPKTFQDALHVTRRLGLRYIWIDSACILQSGPGSVEDWAKEAGMMNKVYQNSFCNISATGSHTSADGLFHERNPASISTTPIEITWDFTEDGSELIDAACHTYQLMNTSIFENGVNAMELMSRAWVFQERLLAPRVLHFGQSQLYWECHRQISCETIASGDGKDITSTGWNLKREFMTLEPSIHPISRQGCYLPSGTQCHLQTGIHRCQVLPGEYQRCWRTWKVIIERYSSCILSYPNDRLVALSGIAKIVSLFTGMSTEDYFAGHWRERLPRSLLWERLVVPKTMTAKTVYIAPTWSWASANEPVLELDAGELADGWHYCLADTAAVLDVITTSASGDPTGQIKYGEITLRGNAALLSSMKAEQVPDDPRSQNMSFEHYRYRSREEVELSGRKQRFCYWFDEEDTEVTELRDVWCLSITICASRENPDGRGRVQTVIYGLLLLHIAHGSGEPDRFERVGTFCLLFGREYPDVFDGATRDFCVV